MDHQAFENLVRRLELDSYAGPAAFRRKVFTISIAAYAALFVALGSLSTLFVLMMTWAYQSQRTVVAIKVGLFGLVLLPLIFVVLKVMFMRLPAPTGRALARADAPKLFEIIDKLRDKLKGPVIHHVLVTDDYNAAISQNARFGIFGGTRNYLIVGLPYMLGTPPKEMLATIAHEYGHLCGNHGKAAAWVYRQRRMFCALYDKVAQDTEDNLVNTMLAAALGRFFPFYSAYTFVLARQNEYEADRTASEMAGNAANAQGLVRDHLLGAWIGMDFWPKLFAKADTMERPPFMPFASMRLAFKASYGDWANKEALDAAWGRRSGVDDTHPCLRERLEAIGAAAALPPLPEVCAADMLFAPGVLKRLVAEFDEQWWRDCGKGWGERFRHVTRSRARIAELSARELAALNVPELQELAMLKADFDGLAAAKPVLEQQLKRPGGPFPKAALLYGRVLLAEDNGRGIEYLREAALNDASLIEEAAKRGYYYLLEKQGDYAANQYWSSVVPEQAAA